jgi:mRNA interferase MazF
MAAVNHASPTIDDESLWPRLAGLPLVVEACEYHRLHAVLAYGFERITTHVRLVGAGVDGLGEDVSVVCEDGTALHETLPALALEGEWTLAGFCDHLATLEQWSQPPEWDVALRCRNWAFESAALDLARRRERSHARGGAVTAGSPGRELCWGPRSTFRATLLEEWLAPCTYALTMQVPRRSTWCGPRGSMTRRPCAPPCRRPPSDDAGARLCATRSVGSPAMQPIVKRCTPFARTWPSSRQPPSAEMVRGEVFRLPAPAHARGREQQGARYAIIVQADDFLGLSTVSVAPTSASARPATFRPTIDVLGTRTRVLVEQTTVVDPQRLGDSAGRLDAAEIEAVDEALRLVLAL